MNARQRATTRDDKQEKIDAETPEAAARKWLWRLSDIERRYTARLVVFAPKANPILPVYAGPPVRFKRVGGKLEQIADGGGDQSSADQTGSAPRSRS